MRIHLTGCLVAAVCFAAGVKGGEKTVLRYDLEPGDSAVYELAIGYQLDVGDQVYKRFVECDLTERCLQVQDDKFIMKMTFGEIDATINWRSDMKLLELEVGYDMTNRWFETEQGYIPADYNYSLEARRK